MLLWKQADHAITTSAGGAMEAFGKWSLETVLGNGGTATVWRATSPGRVEPVALKLLHEGLEEDSAIVDRFCTEVELLRGFEHPGILRCLDSGEDSGRLWSALELCPGGSMADGVVSGRLSVREVSRLCLEVLDALAYLHNRGFVHRDVKPDNVLIDGQSAARLCDFGITRCPLSAATMMGDKMGSPSFMPPEQMDDPHEATPQSDLYAVGATLFACSTRSTAFRLLMPESREPALQELPLPLRQVVDFATAHDPEERFVSAEAMGNVLADAVERL